MRFIAESDDRDLITLGEGEMRLTATLQLFPPDQYPTASTKDAFGPLEFNNPCDAPFSFAANEQTVTTPDNYSGTPIATTFVQHSIDPTFCKIDYFCKSIVPEPLTSDPAVKVPICDDLDIDLLYDTLGNDGSISFTANAADYIAGTFTPGTFKIEIEGTARKSGQKASAYIYMTLEDSCNPPASISNPPGLQDQVYTLTEPNHPQYTPIDFQAVPSYCPIVYEYSWTPLKDANNVDDSAVSGSGDKTFDFFYDKDDAPVTGSQTQTITIKAKSGISKFQAVSGET